MLSKIEITGVIEVKTGMHIGASDGFAAIGAIDSPVAKDPLSRMPYIPGSSLKGKMRGLLAKAINENLELVKKRDDDDELIKRIFGCSKNSKGNPSPSRTIFADTIMSNAEELKNLGAQSETEAKEENTIDPLTAVANPRQIERVIRGAKFPLSIIYNVEKEEELLEDIETLALGFKLLSYDYIGGHGSRGYGRIGFSDINAECVIGEVDEELLKKCNEILGEI